jgi:hypothetical protein
LLLSSASQGRVLYSSSTQEGPLAAVSLIDSHGVWFGSSSGLWLLQPDGKIVKVTEAPVFPLGDCR